MMGWYKEDGKWYYAHICGECGERFSLSQEEEIKITVDNPPTCPACGSRSVGSCGHC